MHLSPLRVLFGCVLTLLASGVACGQHIEPDPAVGESGTASTVVVHDAEDGVLSGVVVTVVDPRGVDRQLGATGEDGRVAFTPELPGVHQLRADLPGDRVLITPYNVRTARPTWIYAVLCVPVGLVLLWMNVRRLRTREGA